MRFAPLFVLLTACSVREGTTTTRAAITADQEVLIEPESTVTPVLDLIHSAKSSIDVVIYDLSQDDIINALATSPVHVRIIVDHNQAIPAVVDRLRAAGAEVQLSSATFSNTHEKTIVVDHARALVFSGNFDRQTFLRGRNYGVIDRNPQDVADLDEVFTADWTGRAPSIEATNLVIAPTNARSRVTEHLAGATKTLDIEAMYVTDRGIEDAIIDAHDRGVTIRLIVNDPSFHLGDSHVLVEKLRALGVPVKRSGERFLHAKMLLVDGMRAFIGSENFSQAGLDHNREAGIITDVDSARILATFQSDWDSSPDFVSDESGPSR